jgi:hypothetical protein
MELEHYPTLWDTNLFICLIFKFLMVLTVTHFNISVTVNPGSKLRQFLLLGASGKMSSLYMTQEIEILIKY